MKTLFSAVLVMLTAGLASGCQQSTASEAKAAPEVPDSCAACHHIRESFAGRNAQQLADVLRAIRDRKLRHPPLGLSDDSDAALEELAEYLAGG